MRGLGTKLVSEAIMVTSRCVRWFTRKVRPKLKKARNFFERGDKRKKNYFLAAIARTRLLQPVAVGRNYLPIDTNNTSCNSYNFKVQTINRTNIEKSFYRL